MKISNPLIFSVVLPIVLGVVFWWGLHSSAMSQQSQISPEDYARGPLREKDAIARMTPQLTPRLAEQKLTLGTPVFIRIFKESRKLEVWLQETDSTDSTNSKDSANLPKFKLFKTYPIAAMSGKLGPKTREGDRQAPEGFYFVPPSQMKPDSRYHLAFNIGYPNIYDRSHNRTGSFIMVHGNRVSIGCFAMTDSGIDEIYTLCATALQQGQPFFRVHVFPFKMTEERMAQETDSPHFAFWQNLKEGFDAFENNRQPPNVTVSNQTYQFQSATTTTPTSNDKPCYKFKP